MKAATALVSLSLLSISLVASGQGPASSANPSSGVTSAQVAARVQAVYNQATTYQADFKQELVSKIYGRTQSSDGHVVFEKPGKMSWRYNAPNRNRVVSDGKDLKVYEPQNHQMIQQPMGQTPYPAVLAFLMGQGKLVTLFDLRLVSPSPMPGGYVLEGTPKQPTPTCQVMLLYVDGATAQVRRVVVVDAQGNRNRFDFNNPIVNTPVPPSEFKFTPPSGTSVVTP